MDKPVPKPEPLPLWMRAFMAVLFVFVYLPSMILLGVIAIIAIPFGMPSKSQKRWY